MKQFNQYILQKTTRNKTHLERTAKFYVEIDVSNSVVFHKLYYKEVLIVSYKRAHFAPPNYYEIIFNMKFQRRNRYEFDRKITPISQLCTNFEKQTKEIS